MDGEPYKGLRAMKPKYEIDQSVYFDGKSYKIIGIKRESTNDPTFIYFLIGLDVRTYGDVWVAENKLSLDNKKYYVLYRSADGLEKREEIDANDNLHYAGIGRSRHCVGKSSINRRYRYTETVLSHDGENTTETYIYDEVI